MKFKKCLSLLMAVILVSAVFVFPQTASADGGMTKRVLLNVAQNKPVFSNQAESADYPLSNLTDGRNTSFIVPTSGANSAKTELTIDLKRKYKIEKIELHSRYDGAIDYLGRQYFEIICANNEDFSDGVLIDYMKEQNDAIFPSSGCFESKGSGNEAYRYVRIKRTGGGYFGYSEIKVFAYQTVTEVSRGKAVTTNAGSAIAGNKAVNGTNNNGNDGWVNDKGTEYNYLSVDLGEKLPVGMIEMEGRNITTENSATRQNIEVYGSNSIDNIKDLTSKNRLTTTDGYKPYFYIGAVGGYYANDVFPYAKYPAMYQTAVDDSEAFRFVTFRNTTLHASAYGEIRLFVINPEILSVNCDENYLYVNFSDEMDTSLNGITLTKADDGTVLSGEFKDAYTYVIDISDADKTASYELLAENDVKNTKGVGLSEDYSLELLNLSPLSAGKISFFEGLYGDGEETENLYGLSEVSAKATVLNSGNKSAVVSAYIALYDGDGRLLKINKNDAEIPSGEKADVVAGLSLDEKTEDGMFLKAFIWNMADDVMIPLASAEKLVSDKYNIYVSPYGSDDASGTQNAPFKTIGRAKEEVRARNEDMTKDININIAGGIYNISETLSFNEADSGMNGCYVNYKAQDGADVMISGGTKIEGWELSDENRNIYKASVSGFDEIRNLYVNGKSARAARSEGRIEPLGFYYENDKIKGYYVSSEDVGLYENAEDIRLFYTQVWKYTLCNVEEIIASENEGENIIRMQDKSFGAATSESVSLPVTEENAFYIENAKELLDMAGEFYFDEDESVIYYMASDDEDMESAEVYVPTLERLMHIEGSDLANKVRNIRFSGIHFAHAARSDIYDGYLGGQAQSVKPLDKHDNSYPLDNTTTGANIRVLRAEDVIFEGNTFSGLTAVALGVYEGSNDIIIRGNKFYDIGDSAVTVGLPSDSYMEDAYYDEAGNYLGRNVALYKPAKHKSSIGDAPSANDGNNKTVSVINDTTDYWQVDLGKEYEISQIRIPARKNYGSNPDVYDGTTLFRRNFKVLASNDEDFADGGVEIARQGSTAFDVKTGFVANTGIKEKFRYVRVQKTVKEHFPFADVLVISPDQKCPVLEVSKRTVIDNNYITRIGEFNLGAPGIQLYYTEDAVISHNVIKDVPYSGICVGWGWLNTVDSTTAKNNKILNNRIENYAMRTYDAGGVYLLGTQRGNIVEGNHMINQPNVYYAFYADSGSVAFTVKNNVFTDVLMSFALGYSYASTDKTDMNVTDNFSTTTNCTINYKDANSVVEAPTVYIKSDVPQAAQAIIDNAGLEDEYASVALNIPDGRWTLSTDDIYGDIIDHQISYEGGSVGESMPDTTIISYYLTPKIKDANKAIELAGDKASAEAIAALKEVINETKAKETIYKNQSYGYNNTTIVPIDRRALVNDGLKLKNAIDAFVGSMME